MLNDTFYPNFEVIVVDDCSTDNTEHSVRSFNDKQYGMLDTNRIRVLPDSKCRVRQQQEKLCSYIQSENKKEIYDILLEINNNINSNGGGVS